jgi:hypothetical protein
MSAQPFAGNRVANAKTLLLSTRSIPIVTAMFFGLAIVLGLIPNARPAAPVGAGVVAFAVSAMRPDYDSFVKQRNA